MSETSLNEKQLDRFNTYIKELWDLFFKGIGYLMTAHGAGLIGCLTLLKDYSSTPQLKGVGFFISCFAYGLTFAAGSFGGLLYYQAKLLQSLAGTGNGPGTATKLVLFVPLALSCGALFVALAAIVRRFGSL